VADMYLAIYGMRPLKH